MKRSILLLFAYLTVSMVYSQDTQKDEHKKALNFELNAVAIGFGPFETKVSESNVSEDKLILESFNKSCFALNLLEFRSMYKDAIGLNLGLGFMQSTLNTSYIKENFYTTIPNYSVVFDKPEYDNPGPIFGDFTLATFDMSVVGKINIGNFSLLPFIGTATGDKTRCTLDANLTELNSGVKSRRSYVWEEKVNRSYKFGLEVRYNFINAPYLGIRSSYATYLVSGTSSFIDRFSDGTESEGLTQNNSFKADFLSFQIFLGFPLWNH